MAANASIDGPSFNFVDPSGAPLPGPMFTGAPDTSDDDALHSIDSFDTWMVNNISVRNVNPGAVGIGSGVDTDNENDCFADEEEETKGAASNDDPLNAEMAKQMFRHISSSQFSQPVYVFGGKQNPIISLQVLYLHFPF